MSAEPGASDAEGAKLVPHLLLAAVTMEHSLSIIPFGILTSYEQSLDLELTKIFIFNENHVTITMYKMTSTIVVGQLHLFNVEITFILSNTSSFLWIQTSRIMACGTFLENIIIYRRS
jgi:hypothetical protein